MVLTLVAAIGLMTVPLAGDGGGAAGQSTPPAAPPAGAAPAAGSPVAALASAVTTSDIDRGWEARFDTDIAALSASDAAASDEVGGAVANIEPSLAPLARRLVEIARDRRASPQGHAGLDRYRRSDADLARREGRQVTSIRSVNRPPALLPEHRDASLRLAWEGLLLGAGWWQTVELSAEVLRSMDPRPSSEVLGVSLVRSIRGFDRVTDQGWRERAILALIAILADVPDAAVLRRFAEAAAVTEDPELDERLIFAIAKSDAWTPILDAARADRSMERHAGFVEQIVQRRGR